MRLYTRIKCKYKKRPANKILFIYPVANVIHVKPRPNDRNTPKQHIATSLGATCCARLATVLRHVATCLMLLAQIWPFSNLSQQHPTCRNTLQHGDLTYTTYWAQTMLRYVALACCHRLAGALCKPGKRRRHEGCNWNGKILEKLKQWSSNLAPEMFITIENKER